MHPLPHAEDRANDRGRERQQPHVPFRLSRNDGLIEGSECVYRLPFGQNNSVGYGDSKNVGGPLPMEGR